MAHGIELILGFPYEDWDKTPFKGVTGSVDDSDKIYATAEKELKDAHKKACIEAGFKFIKTDKKTGYDLYETKLGNRLFVPFRLELHYDPHEMYETIKEAVIGVSISGRYFPVFADWKDENGILYIIVFDDELKNMMEIAIKHITDAIPWMINAKWIVKQKWY